MMFFVGPLPPPVHGFSFINAAVLDRLSSRCSVAVFDRAPSRAASRVRRLLDAAALVAKFFVAVSQRGHPGGVYVGLSGGAGQIIDLVYLLAARGWRRSVVVHHHSFAYLRAPKWYTRLCFAQLGAARHIVLCDCMAALLSSRYGVARHRIDVVSNAAFLASNLHQDTQENTQANTPEKAPLRRASGPMRIGFLSNITRDKGIFLFFDILKSLHDKGITATASIAGPVAPELAAEFAQALRSSLSCTHVGPVYGADKDRFLSELDVLVFPTLYANEAEPVTVLEALREGIPVIANGRGCIEEMIHPGSGRVFSDDAQFVSLASAELASWSAQPQEQWQALRRNAKRSFDRRQSENRQRIDSLLGALTAAAR